MTKIRTYILAFVGLLAVEIGLGNPCTPHDESPQQSQQDNRHEHSNIAMVEGTFEQMKKMEGGWYCMNRKTGYQMMLSTGNKNEEDKYSNDIIIMNPDFKIPDQLSSDLTTESSVSEENPIAPTPKQTPKSSVSEENPIAPGPKQTTIDEVRKKFANFDWVKYFKARRMTSTVAPVVNFDRFTGAGMQDVRVLQ